MASNENQQAAQQPQAGASAPTATGAQPSTTASASTSTGAQAAATAATQKANANIIAALSSAFKTSTGESLQHDKIAQLLIANMDQISELAKQGRLSQAQIEQVCTMCKLNLGRGFGDADFDSQLRQFAQGSLPGQAGSTSQQQTQAKVSHWSQLGTNKERP